MDEKEISRLYTEAGNLENESNLLLYASYWYVSEKKNPRLGFFFLSIPPRMMKEISRLDTEPENQESGHIL